MTTGIQANGTDLDSLLAARITTKIADVNIDSNGSVDISNRFEKLASGSAPSTTNIQSGGADLATLFAGIGTLEAQALSTNITSAAHSEGKGKKKRAFAGFDAGADPKSLSGFGSITTGSYTDGGSNARVVTACYYNTGGQASAHTDSVWVAVTTSPPDTDTTMRKIIIDGTTFTRSSANATGVASGARWWRWDLIGANPFIGANPDPFELWVV